MFEITENCTNQNHVQSNPYYKVVFGTKKKGSFKTVDHLKEVQLIWNFLWQDKKKVTS